ncbi:DUF6355 family natural product biosynthesis protein [Saccharothrix sp. Mg75]|uniref:DUF6355 family natural product biosynthesis protein n=1 Tax=Saccharothrix sp. Mg75 TaxID=3445357 RepID=UPI003EEB6875
MTRTFVMRLLGIAGLALGLTMAVTAGSASAQITMGGPYGPAGENGSYSQIQVHPSPKELFQPPYSAPAEPAPQSRIGTVSTPGSQIQGGVDLAGPARAQAGTDAVTAQACGWYAPNRNSYYVHCGSGKISINVEFWWGAGSTRSICVWPGTTNLSSHSTLQGGLITYAYYNGRGC